VTYIIVRDKGAGMNDHSYQVGDRVWWLYEDTRLYRFTADVPAVITQVRHKTVIIQVTNIDGRIISVHVHPQHLRPREDT
jgi:hypothetical protein